ncbi:rod shape-determining protein MreC [Phosphitispora fastidiosa]|uniref:rod shape-determining protein MreC n=1 Tax=Phosphitispora fastidiosa TaxID=2837202 RepID=UPI001E350823|nr:rod shape-determining protein MreC [Phosphitispora fastidiosa]MBU7008740.1 rod shape-determining protein MreC [Phosphitispora fastidiosa]
MFRYIVNRYVLGFLSLVVLALVLITYTGQDRKGLSPVERVVKDVVTPVEHGVTGIVNSISDTVGSVFTIGSIKSENKKLQGRISSLEAENNLLREYEYQNLRLRELLQFKDTVARDYNTVSASVVGRNPSNWFRTITVNRGESDGLAKNMAVVTSKGLVGRVINVSADSAEVLLIIDSSSAVGSLIQINRVPGVIEGKADDSGMLKMIHLSKEAPVTAKQTVISSGLGGVFPKGLPIGTITEIELESNGLVKYATVRPFVDFNELEEVLIIRSVSAISETAPLDGGGA